MVEFAPELQREWSLEEMRSLRIDHLSVRVCSSVDHEFPEVQGRHTTDIRSYPEIGSIQCEATFIFTDILMVRVWDEADFVSSGADSGDVFEGVTFRRFSKSALLEAYSQRPVPVFHYALICDSTIDIICTKPPTVVLRDSGLFASPQPS